MIEVDIKKRWITLIEYIAENIIDTQNTIFEIRFEIQHGNWKWVWERHFLSSIAIWGIYVKFQGRTCSAGIDKTPLINPWRVEIDEHSKRYHEGYHRFGHVSSMYRSSPFRSTLNTKFITGLDMCQVCTEAVHCVALWTRTLSQVWTCVKYAPKQSIA